MEVVIKEFVEAADRRSIRMRWVLGRGEYTAVIDALEIEQSRCDLIEMARKVAAQELRAERAKIETASSQDFLLAAMKMALFPAD